MHVNLHVNPIVSRRSGEAKINVHRLRVVYIATLMYVPSRDPPRSELSIPGFIS